MTSSKRPAAEAPITDWLATIPDLHACLDEHRAETRKAFAEAKAARDKIASGQAAIAKKAGAAALAAHAVGVKVETIIGALGLGEDGKKPVALWSPGKVMRSIGMWGSGLFILAKVADAAWKPGLGLIEALWRTAIH